MQINTRKREVALKIVYYGPARSGKTTNLEQLYQRLQPDIRGKLATLDTRGDRTLFFDLLPVNFRSKSGTNVTVKLFTVPGQVVHASTRRIVLTGTDALIFVADSQRRETSANNQSFEQMRANLAGLGRDPDRVPTVIQFNKRDLPDVRSEEEIAKVRARGAEPIYLATAIRGSGVVETFRGALEILWAHLEAEHDFGQKLGLTMSELMTGILGGVTGAEAAHV